MRLKTIATTVVFLGFTREAFGQEPLEHGAASFGEAMDRMGAFLGTMPGKCLLVLAAGLMALRVYYAARSAFSVRADPRLGPPRGLLAGYLAKKRLDLLVGQKRYEEAADLLQAWEPGRALEAAELYIKAKRYTRAAALLVANNRLRRAAETYVRAGAHDLAAELFEKAEEIGRAEENYLRAGNKLAAARMFARAGKAERAARYYAEAQSPKEAGEQLEKAGKKREAAEQYVEALALLERANGSAGRGTRPCEKSFGSEKARDELCERILRLFAELGDTDGQIGLLVEHDRTPEAAQLLQTAGRHREAAKLLVEHDLVPEAVKVLDAVGAGPDTRRRVLQKQA